MVDPQDNDGKPTTEQALGRVLQHIGRLELELQAVKGHIRAIASGKADEYTHEPPGSSDEYTQDPPPGASDEYTQDPPPGTSDEYTQDPPLNPS